MTGEVLRISEAQAAQEIRILYERENRKILVLYKFKDLDRILKWRTIEGIEQMTEVFSVPDGEWTEMKNMYSITGHEGSAVILYSGIVTRESVSGILWRELQTIGEITPVWVVD